MFSQRNVMDTIVDTMRSDAKNATCTTVCGFSVQKRFLARRANIANLVIL